MFNFRLIVACKIRFWHFWHLIVLFQRNILKKQSQKQSSEGFQFESLQIYLKRGSDKGGFFVSFPKNFKNIVFYRSSRLQMFFKIDKFKNFAIFTEKHLCWRFFLWKKRIERLTFFQLNFLQILEFIAFYF